jgi:hypothetical protein
MANTGTTINFALKSYCQQRKKQLVFNVPPPRYTPISPYDGIYTQSQLDMRRKAEILKYNNTASSTKTNSLTKAERWAQVVNGRSAINYPSITLTTVDYLGNYKTIVVKYPNTINTYPTTQFIRDDSGKLVVNQTAYQIVGNTGYYNIVINPGGAQYDCANNGLVPTPTSASDVPGPVVYLVNDETVPLYNYGMTRKTYGLDTSTPTIDKWRFTAQSDIPTTNGVDSTFMTLFITDLIDQPFYNFTVQVPFSIYVAGTNLMIDPTNKNWFYPRLSMGINYINFGVNYNDKPMTFHTPPTMTLLTSASNSENLVYSNGSYDGTNYTPLNFDVSFLTPPTDPTESFLAKKYAGALRISNILLPTKPGYVYDFFLQIDTTGIHFPDDALIAESQYNFNIVIPTTTVGSYVNVSNDNTISNNCVVYTQSPPPPPIQSLTLTGV